MPITEYLERNASLYPNEVALVELNPEENRSKKVWKDYSLIESTEEKASRKQLTWREFDEKANRFANVLIRLGYGRGSKVAILLMNCLEWLP
ncbi:MAG: AMP-binding protein, partial [Clostridia bacterium]|nr:AMP-binding protein [Clostridia bacterium]